MSPYLNTDTRQHASKQRDESASPLFFDYDGDQDLDMLLGSRGIIQEVGAFYSSFQLFENRGTTTAPDFIQIDADFMGLSNSQLQDLHPSYADLDGDNRKDLIFSAAASSGQTRIYYWLNTQINGFTAQTTESLESQDGREAMRMTALSEIRELLQREDELDPESVIDVLFNSLTWH